MYSKNKKKNNSEIELFLQIVNINLCVNMNTSSCV